MRSKVFGWLIFTLIWVFAIYIIIIDITPFTYPSWINVYQIKLIAMLVVVFSSIAGLVYWLR